MRTTFLGVNTFLLHGYCVICEIPYLECCFQHIASQL